MQSGTLVFKVDANEGAARTGKATVIYRWGSWCSYSATLLPLLKTMYEKYHSAGLDVIMYTAWGDSEGERNQKEYVLNNGYDIWHNALSSTLTMNEEAGNYTKGAYRPSMDSMMNQNVEYYNAPSRLAIYKRIIELSGEAYSFEKFLEYDIINCK